MKKTPRTRKKLPKFKTEAAERRFWEKHDSVEYVNWPTAKRVVFANLKPSTAAISLRLPASLLNEIKLLANKRDVPYQSLIKVFLREWVDRELGTTPVNSG